MIPFPDKKYDIIYADPPWDYDQRMGTPHIITPYPTMSIDEISEMPVKDMTADDCLLFMWVFNALLKESIQVGESWGFRYSTIAFIWDKQRPNPAMYTIPQCEICLVFRKGKVPQPRGKRNIRQFLSSKRGRHSDKPDEVRHRITEMFPMQSKIELFARVNDRLFPPMEGWDYWGNEAEKVRETDTSGYR